MANYKIPKEINSELKLAKNIYLFDLLFFIGLAIVAMLFQVFIHRSLTIPYYIFFAAIGVISIVRPSSNPEKRMYQVIIITLMRNRATYCAMSREQD